MTIKKFVANLLVSLVLAGCSSVAKPSLVGTWNRTLAEAEIYSYPPIPKMVGFVFRPDGKLDILVQRMIWSGGKKGQLVKPEVQHATFIDQGSAVRIVTGGQSVDFSYEIKDDKLFLASAPKSQFGESSARQIFERK